MQLFVNRKQVQGILSKNWDLQKWNEMNMRKKCIKSDIAASMFIATAPAPSPHISVQVSFEVVDPPAQVLPVSAFHTRFYMKSSWIFQ